MNYKELTSENTTFDANFLRFLRFHKGQYMKKVLLENIKLNKNKQLEKSIFSIKEKVQETASISLKSMLSEFLFS